MVLKGDNHVTDLRIVFVTSHLPRHCGIATFSADVMAAVRAADPHVRCRVAAIDEPNEVRPYGGEVRYPRFLAQYAGKTLRDPLLPYRDIHNITGATLSCQSIGQGVRKALALVHVLFPKERGS